LASADKGQVTVTAQLLVQSSAADEDLAAAAFDGIRAEMTLLRLAVQQLASERAQIIVPDYSETLGDIIERAKKHSQCFKQIIESPALLQTAQTIAAQIIHQGKAARAEEAQALETARSGLATAANAIIERVNSARTRDEQNQRLWIVGAVSATLFTILGTAVPGIINRAAPAAWHWPERSAARSLGMPLSDAGLHLIRTENPAYAQTLIQTAQIIHDNSQALKKCEK
jgi:hypothetical protein